MGAESGAGFGRIGLDGVALVEEALVVDLFEQPPHRFHIFGVVGNIRVFQVHPVTHQPCQFGPFAGVAHHALAAGFVVGLDRYFFTDIFLGNAQCFFHTQFHRKPVRVPTGFARHAIAAHGFVAVKHILDRAAQYVMNARFAIGRGRAFVENKSAVFGAVFNAAAENIFFVPKSAYFTGRGREVELFVGAEFLAHYPLYDLELTHKNTNYKRE